MTVSALHSQIRIGVLALKEHATAATIRNIGNIRQTTVEACSSHADAPCGQIWTPIDIHSFGAAPHLLDRGQSFVVDGLDQSTIKISARKFMATVLNLVHVVTVATAGDPAHVSIRQHAL